LIETLRAKVAELEHELSRHSGNSGKPPSSDTLAQRAAQDRQRVSRAERRAAARKKAKELQERAKTKRQPGKQPGESGQTLARRADPDEIVTHVPGCCFRCGSDLVDAEVTGVECRQVFDVPRVEVKVTEHRAETRRCRCGAATAYLMARLAHFREPRLPHPGVRRTEIRLFEARPIILSARPSSPGLVSANRMERRDCASRLAR